MPRNLLEYMIRHTLTSKAQNFYSHKLVSLQVLCVYINPLNSLKFVLNKLKKDKIKLDKDFYVFTGSTVGVVPIKAKGLYTGKIDKLGSVKSYIF